MVVASQGDLSSLFEQAREAYPDGHPLETLLLPDTIEEAVFGSAQTQERTARTDGRGAAVSPLTLRQQLRAAEDTGQQGEEIFNLWLSTGHAEEDYEWVSRTHARATYDFHIRIAKWPGARGSAFFVDVKATRSALETPIHMSMAEIRWAAAHPNHRIARVHSLAGDTPKLSILAGVHEAARAIMDTAVKALPIGVAVDSFELDTSRLMAEFACDLTLPGN
jgi:hypothetical protein